ncbi:MAG TPA: BBP7 family outer membrane beta-barrel protein [Pirellulaceae bacterium]|jgi:hypothetical protein|nr:BBP7 family outer membrane beta-barrel protein [Pirellulaceae bacterium]
MKTFLWRGVFASLIAAGAVPASAQQGNYGSMLPIASAPQRSVQAQYGGNPQYLAAQNQDQLMPPAEPLPGSHGVVGTGAMVGGNGRSVMEPTPAAGAGMATPDYSRFPGPPAAGQGGYGASAGADCYGSGAGAGYAGGGRAAAGSAAAGYGNGSFVDSGDCWGEDVYCDAPCGPTVFAGANALMLTRDRANPTWLSYQTDNISNQMMKTEDASFGYGGGFEVFAGICCGGGWAVEGRYWGWWPGMAEANAYDPSGVLADGSDLGVVIPNLDMLNYNPGGGVTDVDSLYQNAAHHRIRMENEIHNVELNLFNSPISGGIYDAGVYGAGYAYGGHAAPTVAMNVLGGVRYLRFDENFLFSADPTDGVFTGAADEIHYHIETENNLIGFQIGGNASWFATRRFSVNTGTKLGLFANQMNHRQAIYGSNGYATVGAVGPWAGQAYNVSSDDCRISLLGELDLGASYQVCSWMKVTGGYRVMAVSGVALTENQIPTYFAGLDDVREIDSNGDLLLHGAYAGLEFCF